MAPEGRPSAIPWAQPDFWGNEEALLLDAFRSSWISGGPYVERLEAEVARITRSVHALAVSNGTTALHLAYLGIDLKPGDEVIVPGFAFLAAANVALHMGAIPVFAEVDPDTWCLTASAVERALSSRTRVVVAVHTYGNMCPMDELGELLAGRPITLIEDAAESFGSTHRGRPAGSMARIGVLSFQATKTITTGEGGMVLTQDGDLRERMALYRSHGMAERRYWHVVPGHNFRLPNLLAALGCAQLERLPRILAERDRVRTTYAKYLAGLSGVQLQKITPNVTPVWWAIAVRLDPTWYPMGRDAVMARMADQGIETRPGFYASSEQPVYARHAVPVCEEVARSVISLPTFPSLGDDRIERICSLLASLAGHGR